MPNPLCLFNPAYSPEPCAWTTENGSALKILAGKIFSGTCATGADKAACGTVLQFEKNAGILVQCGGGIYAVTELQRQGKNAAKAKDFINGARGFIDTVLGGQECGVKKT